MPKTFRRKSVRRFPSKKGLSTAQVRQVKKLASQVALKKGADRYFDQQVITTASSSATIQPLTAIAQVDDANKNINGRSGLEITAKSLQVRVSMAPQDTTNLMRIIIFSYDGDGAPGASAILEASSISTWLAPYTTHHSANYKANYDILGDKTFLLYSAGPPKLWNFVKQWKTGHTINYSDTGATTYSKGNLWVLYVSDSGVVSHPAVHIASRVRFNGLN